MRLAGYPADEVIYRVGGLTTLDGGEPARGAGSPLAAAALERGAGEQSLAGERRLPESREFPQVKLCGVERKRGAGGLTRTGKDPGTGPRPVN